MTKHRSDRPELIVKAIAEYRMAHGYGPSIRELRDAVGLASTSGVHAYLVALEKAGRITYDPKHARTLAVTGTVIEDDSADALVRDIHNDPGVAHLRADVQDRLARFYRHRWLS